MRVLGSTPAELFSKRRHINATVLDARQHDAGAIYFQSALGSAEEASLISISGPPRTAATCFRLIAFAELMRYGKRLFFEYRV